MRVLVCGGREFFDSDLLVKTLNELHISKPIHTIIEGGARGADRLASNWAATRNIENVRFEAMWHTWGKAAGMIRNGRMLREGRPDLVVAFAGGKGTANMIKISKEAGIEVMEVK